MTCIIYNRDIFCVLVTAHVSLQTMVLGKIFQYINKEGQKFIITGFLSKPFPELLEDYSHCFSTSHSLFVLSGNTCSSVFIEDDQ